MTIGFSRYATGSSSQPEITRRPLVTQTTGDLAGLVRLAGDCNGVARERLDDDRVDRSVVEVVDDAMPEGFDDRRQREPPVRVGIVDEDDRHTTDSFALPRRKRAVRRMNRV